MDTNTNNPIQHIVIIGAGAAGLTTALRLQQHGMKVTVLEANHRVGGRMKTVELGGVSVDGGGSWFGPKQNAALKLIKELDLKTFPSRLATGRHLLIRDGKSSGFTGELPPIGWLDSADLGIAQMRIDSLARKHGHQAAWSSPEATKLDNTTVADWMNSNTRTSGAKFMLENIVNLSFGVESKELSMLGFLSHVISAGSLDELVGTTGRALDCHVEGGSQMIASTIADRLKTHIITGAKVTHIVQADYHVEVLTEKDCFQATRVVIATDIVNAGSITYQPPLPEETLKLLRSYRYGSGMKACISYSTPFWRIAGLSGQVYSDGIAAYICEVTPPNYSGGVLIAFISENRGLPGKLRAAVLEQLASIFGDEARKPVQYEECNWSDEKYVSGCVPAVPCGLLSTVGHQLGKQFNRIHFAGAETSSVWEGHIDGAIYSGERAAKEVMASVQV